MERVEPAFEVCCAAHAGERAVAAKGRWATAALAASLLLVSPGTPAAYSPPARLIVITDDSYPPYLFRAEDGRLQGIVRDKWDLWSRHTGVPVELEGTTWAKAQERVLGNAADVIDALAHTEAREGLYEFSTSYAAVEARVFFHRSISGINDVASMRGFTIGAKEGSACSNWLTQRGIEAIRPYPTSEVLVQAAGAGEIRLFCMDVPAAQYFLFKQKFADEFRQTQPLYSARFHWAVVKGRTDLRDFIQDGYARISAQDLQDIDARWIGSPLKLPINPRYFYYLGALAAVTLASALALVAWNRTLRLRVAARTAELDGQKQVLELIAEGAPLDTTLGALARVIEAQSPGMFCSILLLDEEGARVRHGAAPSLPESFARAIDGEPIGERAGSCGTAAFRREPVIVEDIATDPLWEAYRGLAAEHGLRACWSAPIFDTRQRVLGTFALYFREPGRPAPRHLRLIELATHTAAIAISKQREADALRESATRLSLATQASNIGLWDWDIAGNRVYFSPEWKGQLGYRDGEIAVRPGEWEARLHAEDRTRVVARLQSCLKDPRLDYETEFRMRHKDGSYRWIYARGLILRDPEGRPRRMLGCHIDITERKHSEEQLRLSFARLQELSRRLVEVEEVERRNINRELHDRVGQNLSALNLSLGLLRNQLPEVALRAVRARLEDARILLETTSKEVRDVMAELRPAALDDYGLFAALRHHAATVAGRLGIPIAVEGKDLDARLPPTTETALFRIVQEALNNVAKHARAQYVTIALTATPLYVRLTVTDDGVGFDAAHPAGGAPTYGIVTMHERAEAAGARLTIQSAPGAGTRVAVEIPKAPL